MTKYEITGMGIGMMWYSLFLTVAAWGVMLYAIVCLEATRGELIFYWIVFLYFTYGLIGLPWYYLTEPFYTGSFTFDEKGITMYVGFAGKKAYYHAWEEFVETDIVYDNMSRGFYMYFSTSPLTAKEKQVFLSKTRKDSNRIAFFQFRYDVLNEMLPILPEKLSQKLKFKVEYYHRHMGITQRLNHIHTP